MAMRTVFSGNGMLRVKDARDIEVNGFEIEREGVMKLKPLYEAIHDFFLENGYEHPQSGGDLYEDLYWERWMPQGHKEQQIWWRLKKDVNKYIRYYIQFDYQTLLVNPSEVAHKGKKVKAEFIDLIIRVKAYIQFDVENKFEKTLRGQMKKMFFNKMYKQEIEDYKMDLFQFTQEVQRMIKHILEMQTDKETFEPHVPQMGYKNL